MSSRPRAGRIPRHRAHGAGGGGGGHGGGDARWLVTYADMLTLLMVLFLVLWVISTIDLKKFEEFKQGLGAFGNPAASETVASPGGASPPATGPLAGPGTADPASMTVTVTVPGVATPAMGSPADPIDGAAAGEPAVTPSAPPPLLDAGDLVATAHEVEAAIAAAGLPDIVAVSAEERGLVVRIASDEVLFDAASATVTPAGAGILAVVAPTLLEFSNQIVVEGHTDHRPLRREGYDNWDLSVDRAVSVIKLLRDSFGLPQDRLGAAGYGDQRPLDAGSDDAALARNRRVEIVVLAS